MSPEERAAKCIEKMADYPNRYPAQVIAAAIREAVAEERARCIGIIDYAQVARKRIAAQSSGGVRNTFAAEAAALGSLRPLIGSNHAPPKVTP